MPLSVEQFRARFCKDIKTSEDETDKSSWTLINMGASWGDLAVFSCEELMQEPQKPKVIKPKVIKPKVIRPKAINPTTFKPKQIKTPAQDWCESHSRFSMGVLTITQGEQDFMNLMWEATAPDNILEPITDDDVSPQIWRPQEHGYCLNCNFKIHPNPPAHFTKEQRNYCCGWCSTSLGRGHGGHCMGEQSGHRHSCY